MFVIPSVDILNGNCVQLINGKEGTAEIFGTPQEWVAKLKKNGFDRIHIIDLNAALESGSNEKIITDIVQTNKNIKLQVGGGIRTIEQAVSLHEIGVDRIIIGSKALNQQFLRKLNNHVSKAKIMAALDLKQGFVVTNGWQTMTSKTFHDIKKQISPFIGSILSTDTDSEGLLDGPNKKLLYQIKQKDIPVFASGGFTCKKDIYLAERLGFSGVVIGRALYKKKLNLQELW